MKCPNCSANLLMTTRNDVEIDYCPECRGVWLDRGELDKILERVADERQVQGRAQVIREDTRSYDAPMMDKRKRDDDSDLFDMDIDRRDSRYSDDDRRYSNDSDYNKKKKKSGILGEIFEIFG